MDKFSKEKCKNFGYTFAFLSLILAIYFFFFIDQLYLIFLIISILLFLVAKKIPLMLKYPGFIWEQFGLFLGKIITPIILTIVYIITIIPINIVLRLFRVDILNMKIENKKKSYWLKNNKKIINFKDQY
tara:strand:+ start:1165 stop:1551 length:387 start_codon:yes stop_codon:yes gene_type:complete